MKDFSRPQILISKCIEFCNCRYNGDLIHSIAVADLKKYVDFIPVCPEVEIGLGVPRTAVRIVEDEDENLNLVETGTGKNYSKKMRSFAEYYLDSIKMEEIDAFLMKRSSPSCGYKDAKVYKTISKGPPMRKNSSGFFTQVIENKFKGKIIETEGRLTNFNIREDFYTKIFMMSEFREISKGKRMRDLVEFHTNNKFLIMSYSSSHLKKLGNIAANRNKEKAEAVFEEYGKELQLALNRTRRVTANINVIMHLMGFFSEKVTKGEKDFLLERIEKYRNKMLPLSVLVSIIEVWVVRFAQEYLRAQSIFNPFPRELISVTDSGKGREHA